MAPILLANRRLTNSNDVDLVENAWAENYVVLGSTSNGSSGSLYLLFGRRKPRRGYIYRKLDRMDHADSGIPTNHRKDHLREPYPESEECPLLLSGLMRPDG